MNSDVKEEYKCLGQFNLKYIDFGNIEDFLIEQGRKLSLKTIANMKSGLHDKKLNLSSLMEFSGLPLTKYTVRLFYKRALLFFYRGLYQNFPQQTASLLGQFKNLRNLFIRLMHVL